MTATKTAQTCIDYEKRANNIIALYNGAYDKTKVTFEAWLYKYITTKTARTWTLYRAAILHSLENKKIDIKNITHEKAQQIILNLRNLETKKKKDSKATSRLKYKHLPMGLYNKLKSELLKVSASKYDLILYHWLRATRATGLRPHEWMTLSIKLSKTEKNTFILTVLNGKHTNNRSFGQFRKLHLQANDDIIKSIMMTWKTLKENHSSEDTNIHNRFYKACRDRLRWMNSKIGCGGKKKRITIYSARHQFKADMQLKGLSDEEIAALMGHGSVATANINYGKKRFARNTQTNIRPSQQDVEKVRDLNANRIIKVPPYLQHSPENTQVSVNE